MFSYCATVLKAYQPAAAIPFNFVDINVKKKVVSERWSSIFRRQNSIKEQKTETENIHL